MTTSSTTTVSDLNWLEAMFEQNLRESIEAKRKALADAHLRERFALATARVIKAYEQGGRLYIAGNGGSAADAQHLAAEFVSKLANDRDP